MYRDALQTARERLDKARREVTERGKPLTPAIRSKLPRAVVEQLDTLQAKFDPAEETVAAVEESEAAVESYERKLVDALNLVAQLESARSAGRGSLRARLAVRRDGPSEGHPVLWTLTAALALGTALFLLPGFAIDKARANLERCFSHAELPPEGQPADCRVRTLGWAKLVPWYRREAKALDLALEQRIAQAELSTATAVTPDASARDDAAARLAALTPPPASPAKELVEAGALAALAQLDFADREGVALAAAVAVGDLERTRELAMRPYHERLWRAGQARDSDAAAAIDGNLRRGAWLCLLGQKDAGRRLLEELDARYQAWATPLVGGHDQARVALAACTAPGLTVPTPASDVSAQRVHLLRLAGGAWAPERRAAASAALQTPVVRLALQALYSAPDGAHSAVEPLAGQGEPELFLLPAELASRIPHDETAWSTGGLLVDELPVPPEALQALASRIVAHHAKPSPPAPPGPDDALGIGSVGAFGVGGLSGRGPLHTRSEQLSQAWALQVMAARIYVARGEGARAREALDAASAAHALRETTGGVGLQEAQLREAPIRHAAGDAAGAERLLRAIIDDPSFAESYAGVRETAHLHHALALASLGRFEEAHAAAQAADEAVVTTAQRSLSPALWLRAALALRTGATAPIPMLDGVVEDAPGSRADPRDVKVLRWYWWLATSPEGPARRRDRQATPAHRKVRLDVLPALVYLAGRAVPDGAGVEIWLDRVLGHQLLSGDPRVALARAEAARWRGDTEAAVRWQKHAEASQGLARDVPSTVLFTLTRHGLPEQGDD